MRWYKKRLVVFGATLLLFAAFVSAACSTSKSESPSEEDLVVTAAIRSAKWTQTAEAAWTPTPGEPTVTPTATPEPTNTPLPTSTPTVTPTPDPIFEDVGFGESAEEEEERLLIERAYLNGRTDACKEEDGKVWFCPGGDVYRDEELSWIMEYPEYKAQAKLPGSLDELEDVDDSELAAVLDKAISLGMYPKLLWCHGGSPGWICPKEFGRKPITSEQAPVFALKGAFGREWAPPYEYAGFFYPEMGKTNPYTMWFEALIHLHIYERGLRPAFWGREAPVSKHTMVVLNEKALDAAARESVAGVSVGTTANVTYDGSFSANSTKVFASISIPKSACSNPILVGFARKVSNSPVLSKLLGPVLRPLLYPCIPDCGDGLSCEEATGQHCIGCENGNDVGDQVAEWGTVWDCPPGVEMGGPGCSEYLHPDCLPPPDPGPGPGPGPTTIPSPTPIPQPTATTVPPPPGATPPPPGDDGGGEEVPEEEPTGFVLQQPAPWELMCLYNPEDIDDMQKLLSDEEREALRWADNESVISLSPENRICTTDLYSWDFVAETSMAMPAFKGLETQPGSSKFEDTKGTQNEELYALWFTLGLYPDKLWCRATDGFLCPSFATVKHFVEREEAAEEAMMLVYGSRVWTRLEVTPNEDFQEFLEEFPDVAARKEFIKGIYLLKKDLKYYRSIGPSMFCPYGPFCKGTKIQWITLLYRVNKFHEEFGYPPESPLYETNPAPFWEMLQRPPTLTPAPTPTPPITSTPTP